MKTFTTRLLSMAFLVLLVLGFAAQLQAQTIVKCDVPFEFSLGGQVYPNGVYSFTIDKDGASKVVALRNWDSSQGRIVEAAVADQDVDLGTRVNFTRYGSHYLLSSLSLSEAGISLHFAPTRAEREMMVGARAEAVSVMASR